MAEWLCRGLQILVQRFDSASGLHLRNHCATGVFSSFGGLLVAENVLHGVASENG
jgi:hypothetical protein